MAIEETMLYNEINTIMTTGPKPVMKRWEAIIHANGEDVQAIYVEDRDRDCNFLTDYAPAILLRAVFPAGIAQFKIIPYRSNLEMTVKVYPQTETNPPSDDKTQPVRVYRYRATLESNTSKVLEGNQPHLIDQHVADKADLQTLQFQLLDLNIERMRMISIGGIYRNCTAVDLIRYLLTTHSQTKHTDSAVAIKGVTVAPGYTKDVRKHIILEDHTPLMDAPRQIESKTSGVYSAGFEYYLYGNYWFLFAPFDTTAYQKAQKTMTLINVPANRFPEPERSYRETPTQLLVLATGNIKHTDTSEQAQLNLGNGVSFVDANMVMQYATVENNKATVKRALNVSDGVAQQRDNGLNLVRASPKRITANYLAEYSQLARRTGSFIQAIWEHSNPDLVYPGMPVKYMYLQNHQVEEVYGVLVGIHDYDLPVTINVQNRRLQTKSVLTVFIDRKVVINPKV